MDKKANKIHENLVFMKINNRTVQYQLLHTTINTNIYLITGQPLSSFLFD